MADRPEAVLNGSEKGRKGHYKGDGEDSNPPVKNIERDPNLRTHSGLLHGSSLLEYAARPH